MKKLCMFFFFLTLVGCNGDKGVMPDPPEPRYISIDEIVTDVASGGRMYAGKAVKINGIVDLETDSFKHKNAITLTTSNLNVEFLILDRQFLSIPREYNKPIGEYKHGDSYDFYVFVSHIIPPSLLFTGYQVRAELIIDEVFEDMVTFLFHVESGTGDSYIGKIINLSAIVRSDVEHVFGAIDPETLEDLDDTIFLETNDENIYFWITNNARPPEVMHKYDYDTLYDFKVFIMNIEARSDIGYNIHSNIVLDEPAY